MGVLGALFGLASGVMGLVGQGAQAGYTKEQQKLQSKLNREEMAYSQGLQDSTQEKLMNEMYGRNVSGMKNSGLNPATANGVSPSVPSGGHPSTGGVGPQGPPVSNLGAMMADAAKEGDLLQAQKDNIKANTELIKSQTDDQKWRNSDTFRDLVKNGMSEEIALNIAKIKESNSNVDFNVHKMAEVDQNIQESLSRVGLNRQQIQESQERCNQMIISCREMLQNVSESKQREIVHQSSAAVNYALRDLYEKTSKGQEITNQDLERAYKAKDSLLYPVYDQDGKPTGKYRSHWAQESSTQGVANTISAEILDYELQTLKTMTPKERQKYLMSHDIARTAISGLTAGAVAAAGYSKFTAGRSTPIAGFR